MNSEAVKLEETTTESASTAPTGPRNVKKEVLAQFQRIFTTEVIEAFNNWADTDAEPCKCEGGHDILVISENGRRWEPKSDKAVCKREVAWRHYVRVREERIKSGALQ